MTIKVSTLVKELGLQETGLPARVSPVTTLVACRVHQKMAIAAGEPGIPATLGLVELEAPVH